MTPSVPSSRSTRGFGARRCRIWHRAADGDRRGRVAVAGDGHATGCEQEDDGHCEGAHGLASGPRHVRCRHRSPSPPNRRDRKETTAALPGRALGEAVDDDPEGVARSPPGRIGVGRAGHEHGALVQSAEEDVGQGLDRCVADGARPHGDLENGGDHPQAIGHVDLAPCLPAQDGGPLEKHDALSELIAFDAQGRAIVEGPTVQLGTEESYAPTCYPCYHARVEAAGEVQAELWVEPEPAPAPAHVA